MREHEEILLGGMFRPSEQNCPTREGELIESLDKIYDIPNPRVGMRVYVENTGKEYIVKSLKEKTIGGVTVPDAVVKTFEEAITQESLSPLLEAISNETENRLAALNSIKGQAALFGTFVSRAEAEGLLVKYENIDHNEGAFSIPVATEGKAGVMSAEDKRKLDAAGSGATKIVWGASSNMNDFKTPGVYDIYGERTRQDDNLPILNASSGHSIAARLTVVASTLQPANNEICVTQFLQLSNRIGGEGTTYVRTYNENNNGMNGWSAWQKQMGMVETYMSSDTLTIDVDTMPIGVGLNGMIDNGMYSGIYSDGVIEYPGTGGEFDPNSATFLETFVLVVINDYAATGKLNLPRHITQLKYAIDAITGQSTVKKRVGTGNNAISWSDWTDIGGGNTYLNPNDYIEFNYLSKLGVGTFEFSGTLLHDDFPDSIWRYIWDLGIRNNQFTMKVVIDSSTTATATIMGCGKYDIVTFNPSTNSDVVSIINGSIINALNTEV